MSSLLTPVPVISVVNSSTKDLGAKLSDLIVAAQTYVDQFLNPVWHVSCRLIEQDAVPDNGWAIVFKDVADVEGAEGYHESNPTNLPVAYVFVQTTLEAGDKVPVTFSHELAELLVDPMCEKMSMNMETGDIYSYEVCDACEDRDFPINGIPFSDFVTPAWFQSWRASGSAKFDLLDFLKAPFTLDAGGYASVLKAGSGEVTQIFGSKKKEARFAREDRRLHRTSHWMNRMRRHHSCNAPVGKQPSPPFSV